MQLHSHCYRGIASKWPGILQLSLTFKQSTRAWFLFVIKIPVDLRIVFFSTFPDLPTEKLQTSVFSSPAIADIPV